MPRVIVNRELCDLCELCVKYCPTYVFYRGDDAIRSDDDKCIECYACIPLCPRGAIEIVGDDP